MVGAIKKVGFCLHSGAVVFTSEDLVCAARIRYAFQRFLCLLRFLNIGFLRIETRLFR